ncbi:MAG: glycosyltransferase [Bacteroidia bacterium]|jgi:glycosyltransferase involved in cell wall biosynthesis|nr:glycosyltransferase [Bacteroidia bacterium]
MNQPLISLITVCYQAEALIKETLASAVKQTYKNIELVIIDGGSTDQTVAIAQTFKPYIGELISEPDLGIYDAMNKGIRAAKGEWIYFLNAGDAFYNEHVLTSIFTKDLTGIDFIYGKMQTVNEPTGINYIGGHKVVAKDFYFKYPICHQTTFTRKSAFGYMPFYNHNLRIMADNNWQMHFFSKFEDKTLFVDEIIAFYDIQGASYHKRMKGYREFLSYAYKFLPLSVYVINVLLYPLIWLKVKIIRTFQHQPWFKAYRQRKFKGKLANV